MPFIAQDWRHLLLSGEAIVIGAALVSAGLIAVLWPWFRRYALARPNARSSHREPTPQGGGIAVIGATVAVVVLAASFAPFPIDTPQLGWLLAAAVGVSVLGIVDDVCAVQALLRLVVQLAAVILVIATTPAELRPISTVPWWVERVLLVAGALWFINLVNFMDGVDWMTVAEVMPVTGALVCLGAIDILPPVATLVALALLGAILGFAPFNRPVARLFLGDAGSLPLGLLIGWLLMILASSGYIVEAIILPLYYLADATVTLLRRLYQGVNVFEAHRRHFYQHAIDNGWSTYAVVLRVFVLNVGLAGLVIGSILLDLRDIMRLAVLAVAIMLVSILLAQFARASGPARRMT
jgi:UDP-N-acetylmuramyl pentapeptide phosphotransferase/UDP-N-acetylglucosamine-1-phosphate transferase